MKNTFIKSLISNTAIIGIGSALSKLLIFILVPILTRELSPEDYGISELIVNTVNLVVPIFTLVIFEAILRYTLDNTNDKTAVLAVGIRVTVYGILILTPVVLLISCFWDNDFVLVSFLGLYIMSAFKNCFVYYARGKNKFVIITSISVIEGIALLNLVVLFVCTFNQGVYGYIAGMFISNMLANILYCYLLHINIFSFLKVRNNELEKSMIMYSVPMIFNSIGWWVNNVLDRYMLSFFCSISLTGIYSVSYKIPGLLNTIVDVFMQAWKVSATEEYENGRISHYNKGYTVFVYSSILICSFLICFSKLFSTVLFGLEYQDAWKYSVVLIIAFLFNGISGYIGTIFTAVKQTKYIAYSTVVGAIVNIILNFILIPTYTALGVGIATMISNIVIWCYRGYFVNRYLKIEIINYKLVLFILLLLLEAFFMLTQLSQVAVWLMLIIISCLCINEIICLRNKWLK